MSVPKLSASQWKSISNMKWEKHAEIVRNFLQDEWRTFTPKVMKVFGKNNFQLKNEKLYLFEREIVTDKQRLHDIGE